MEMSLSEAMQHRASLAQRIDALGFRAAEVGDMRGTALQRRFDTKFVLNARHLPELLALLQPDYSLLSAQGIALARYRTLYFDAPGYASVIAHHRGRRPRTKVRIRHHVDRKLSFLEVKLKTGAERTDKARHALPFGCEELDADAQAFLAGQGLSEPSSLKPSLRTDFDRITLIGRARERVTLDVGLSFSGGGGEEAFAGLCIVEVKQARVMSRSPVVLALRRCGARRRRISKYCTAASVLLPELRLGRFKPVLRDARRVIDG
jgi:hypothetical protein